MYILILYFQLSMDAGEGNGDNVSLKRQRTPLSDSEDNVLSPGVYAIQSTTNQCLQSFILSVFFYFFIITKGTKVRSGKGWNQLVGRITVQSHLLLNAYLSYKQNQTHQWFPLSVLEFSCSLIKEMVVCLFLLSNFFL